MKSIPWILLMTLLLSACAGSLTSAEPTPTFTVSLELPTVFIPPEQPPTSIPATITYTTAPTEFPTSTVIAPSPTLPPTEASNPNFQVSALDGMALVRVEDFWMDQTEVTNGQYQRCVAAGACSLPAEYSSNKVPNYYGNPTYAQFPVTKIDISAARAYCAWAGRRLLTLAQWQTAARGLDNRPYATGAQATCTLANLNDCFGDPIQVASFPAGAYGIYDMVGNVYEWIDTPREDGYAVMGGSWFDDADAARTDRVRWRYANATSSKLGFRCVQP